MNLGNTATAVGQRLGVDTSSASTRDGAAVRSFLTTWHNTLWRAYLWKDSILEFVLPMSPQQVYSPLNNYMPTKGHVIYPPIIEQILGVRLGCRSLNVQRPMFYYRANYGAFFKAGYAADFQLLSACVWEFDTVQQLGVINSNAADNSQIVTIDELQADGVTITRNTYALNNAGMGIQSTDRIDNFIKPQTQGTASIGISGTSPNLIPNGAQYDGGGQYSVFGLLAIGQSYTITWGANDQTFIYGISGPGQTIVFTPGVGLTTTFTLPLGSNVAFFNGTEFNQPVTATIQPTGDTIAPIVSILTANQTSAPKSQRIQLIGKPINGRQANENLYTLGKRTIPTYVSDSDVPGVAGFTEILIPLAYYLFKQRDEQGGSPDATSALVEAMGPDYITKGIPGGLLKTLIFQETEQAAFNSRVVPAHGFGGSDYRYPISDKSDPYCSGWGV